MKPGTTFFYSTCNSFSVKVNIFTMAYKTDLQSRLWIWFSIISLTSYFSALLLTSSAPAHLLLILPPSKIYILNITCIHPCPNFPFSIDLCCYLIKKFPNKSPLFLEYVNMQLSNIL